MRTQISLSIESESQLKRYKPLCFLIAILSFSFGLLTLYAGKADAQERGIKVSPSLLELKVVPPTTVRTPISVENPGDETANLTIEFREFKSGRKLGGEIEYLPTNSSGFLKNVALIENTDPKTNVSIGPGQKKNFTLQITISEKENPSDYYFSVLFIRSDSTNQENESPNISNSFTYINTAVATNVLLSVNPSERQNTKSLLINEFATKQLVDKGPVLFNIKLQNNGLSYVKPKGVIYIKNMFGQLIGKIDLPAQNILAGSSRFLGSATQQSTPKVIWNETFLLGPYNATLEIETEAGKPPLKKSIRFTAVPLKLIVGVLTFVIIALVTVKRAKTKMNSK